MNTRSKRWASAALLLSLIAAFIVSLRVEQRAPAPAEAARSGGASDLRARDKANDRPMLDMRPAAPTDVSLSGQVKSADGTVLANATVCAVCAACDSISPGNRPVCVRSDAQGRYQLSGLSAGDYRIAIGAAGHASTLVSNGKVVTVGKDGLVTAKLDAKLEPGGAMLSGMVTDATGGPVADAIVQANSTYSEGKLMPQETTSDATGAFSLSVSEGPVLVMAFAPGYAHASVTRHAPDLGVRLVVTPAARISGRVVTVDGQPVAGAQVRAAGFAGEQGAAVSDGATGSFVLEGLRPGSYTIEASADGWRSTKPANAVVDLLESISDVVLTLDRAFAVEGVVLLGDSPCELGEVRIGQRSGAGAMYNAVTQPSGAVRVEAIPPGVYDSMASCAGLGFVQGPQIQITNSDIRGMKWSLEAGVDIALRAQSSAGTPVPRVGVTLDPVGADMSRKFIEQRQGSTAEDGRLVLRRVKPGQYRVFATGMKTPLELAVSEETIKSEVVLSIEAAGFIEVHVRTPAGEPNEDVAVSAVSHQPSAAMAFAERKGRGVFSLGPLAVGQYRVEVRDGVNPRQQAGGTTPTEVRMDETTTLEVTFGGYDGVIGGRVASGPDEPLANVWVSAVPSDWEADAPGQMLANTTQAEARRALTDSQGGFKLTELNPAGTYTISASRPLGGAARVEGAKVGQNVEILMPAIGSIAGSVVSASREPIVGGFQVSLINTSAGQTLVQVFSDPSGRFTIENVAPGAIEIAVVASNAEQASRTITLFPGQVMTDLVFELATETAAAN